MPVVKQKEKTMYNGSIETLKKRYGQIFKIKHVWTEKIGFVKLFQIEGSQSKRNTCIDVSRGQDTKYMSETMHLGAMRQENIEDVAYPRPLCSYNPTTILIVVKNIENVAMFGYLSSITPSVTLSPVEY